MVGTILLLRDDGVARLTISNPTHRNAMSLSMWEQLGETLRGLRDDPDLRVVMLTGEGTDSFCAGSDLHEFGEQRSTPEANRRYEKIAFEAVSTLQSFPRPTIAAIRGHCIGGGLALAISCDLRVAGAGAVFGIPAARIGVGYRYAGIKRLTDLVGVSAGKRIFFTAQSFPAAEAGRMGLVDTVVADGEVDAAADELAGVIARNAPLTVIAAKYAIDTAARPGAEDDLAICDELAERCFASQDYAEGLRAFAEKRRPTFRGN